MNKARWRRCNYSSTNIGRLASGRAVRSKSCAREAVPCAAARARPHRRRPAALPTNALVRPEQGRWMAVGEQTNTKT